MNTREKLITLTAALLEPQPKFSVGDIVTWKDGLKHKRIDGEFVITALLDEPVMDLEQGPGSAYFREPNDVKVAYFSSMNGDLIEAHLDSRRLKRAPTH